MTEEEGESFKSTRLRMAGDGDNIGLLRTAVGYREGAAVAPPALISLALLNWQCEREVLGRLRTPLTYDLV